MNQDIIQYILQNRERYTREAIDEELRRAGFHPEQIEAAWQAVANMPPNIPLNPPPQYPQPPYNYYPGSQQQYYYAPPPPPRPTNGAVFWLTTIGYIFGVPIVTGLVGSLVPQLTPLILIAVVIGTIVAMVTLRQKNPELARGLQWGLIVLAILTVVLPFVALIIIAGICVVALGATR